MTEVTTEQDRDGVQAQPSAGTPSQFEGDPETGIAGPGTVAALEFSAGLEQVAGFARGPLGAASIRHRWPETVPAVIAAELAPVGELLAVWQRGQTVDVPPVPELDPILARLSVEGSVLAGPELAAVKATVAAARIAASELSRVGQDAPNAARLVVSLPDRSLDQRLAAAIDDEGEVLDSASPGLLRARREIHAARERLVKKLETILRGVDSQALPQGAQVTIRGDRYVIPVRRDSRARPEGIVHDESASHGTLFVEPTAAIEFGNALRSAFAQAERELLLVLRELTERVRPERETLARAHEMCVRGDDLIARVRYAHSVNGVLPKIGSASLILVHARHPLLLARGVEVVPFDLTLDPDERTLLISGPNAGGKTVLLKTIGLSAMLAQSGIVPPVGPGTELPVFERVFADIGDHQSIAADLSTFSAHVTVLRDVLSRADQATLVLLDEVGSGTDPAEGAALARATLEALTARGARTVVTSHLGSLKTLASEVPGIVNGSLEFDAALLRPTFRFRKGVPGRSYGLAIARRLGIDRAVLERAEAEVPSQERALDELLANVEERARQLEKRERDLGHRQVDVERREVVAQTTEAEHATRERELRRLERDAEKTARQDARRYLLEARSKVEEAIRLAQLAGDHADATEVRRLVEQAAQSESDALSALDQQPEPGGLADLAPGQRVRLTTGGVGTVIEIRSDGKAAVALGAVKVVVPQAELTIVSGSGAAPTRAHKPTQVDEATPEAPFEVDLRGLRADEAEAATQAAVDAAVRAENPFLRLIHGMGTGVVRDRVRRVLKDDRRVARFDFAPRHQGGTGVTIAEFED